MEFFFSLQHPDQQSDVAQVKPTHLKTWGHTPAQNADSGKKTWINSVVILWGWVTPLLIDNTLSSPCNPPRNSIISDLYLSAQALLYVWLFAGDSFLMNYTVTLFSSIISPPQHNSGNNTFYEMMLSECFVLYAGASKLLFQRFNLLQRETVGPVRSIGWLPSSSVL